MWLWKISECKCLNFYLFKCRCIYIHTYVHMYVYNMTLLLIVTFIIMKSFFLVLIHNDEIVFLKERKRKINFENINYTWAIFVAYNELKKNYKDRL